MRSVKLNNFDLPNLGKSIFNLSYKYNVPEDLRGEMGGGGGCPLPSFCKGSRNVCIRSKNV